MSLKAIVVALTFTVAIPVFAQAPPSATEGRLHFKVGAGFSDFNGNFNTGGLMGGALWVDFKPPKVPRILGGLSLEAEARGVSVAENSPTETGTFRQATAGGGPMYTWLRYNNFHPYAKFIVSYAGQKYYLNSPKYRFETETVYAPGGGLEYRVFRDLWARADYEYQIWPDQFGISKWTLDPQGVTVGLTYDLSHAHHH